jgi:hypothetical protein
MDPQDVERVAAPPLHEGGHHLRFHRVLLGLAHRVADSWTSRSV